MNGGWPVYKSRPERGSFQSSPHSVNEASIRGALLWSSAELKHIARRPALSHRSRKIARNSRLYTRDRDVKYYPCNTFKNSFLFCSMFIEDPPRLEE
ncbi:hypothetical protein LSTR_LSTR003338 [Laodelphax striatellus]|uniref:Uncharacterized protein n=1 Tax=Laodelphax striatellus TaxID=195883 RepID=A0A482X5M9_LAOST|nr:hypothetical protein LSTR_LSTR003338 [Laodelphax striatellus]